MVALRRHIIPLVFRVSWYERLILSRQGTGSNTTLAAFLLFSETKNPLQQYTNNKTNTVFSSYLFVFTRRKNGHWLVLF